MIDHEIDFTEVDKQIDFHLRRIPKKLFPAHFDIDDFRQDIYLKLLVRKMYFDDTIASRKTYFDRIVKYRIKTRLGRLRWKRNQTDHRLPEEDSELIPPLNDVKRGELDMVEGNVFSLEVRKALGQMDEDDRKFCELLMHYRPYEVAITLGVSKKTVCRRMKLLKPFFIKAGLRPGYFNEN